MYFCLNLKPNFKFLGVTISILVHYNTNGVPLQHTPLKKNTRNLLIKEIIQKFLENPLRLCSSEAQAKCLGNPWKS